MYEAKRGRAVYVVTQHRAVYAKRLIPCDRGRWAAAGQRRRRAAVFSLSLESGVRTHSGGGFFFSFFSFKAPNRMLLHQL